MSSDNPQDSLSMADLAAVLVGTNEENAQKDITRHILESLAPNVRKRVTVLQEIQTKHDELEKKYFEERSALEDRYLKFYEPFYKGRYEIVNGIAEVDGVTENASAKDGKGKGVPEFWLSAMKANETVSMQITERDEDALKYLKDLKWSKLDEPKGFKLEFLFDPNPYFMNAVLTKTYHLIEETEPILERAIGTPIEWNPGKNLTRKVLRRKPKKGETNAKPITKVEPCESFFNFFSPPQVPGEDEDIDHEMAEELQDMMEQDYEIGSTIRDKIIPHAVSWFTGEAVEGDDIDGGDDSEDMEDDEEEEEEDADDEDEEADA